jgi:hypothetical protein
VYTCSELLATRAECVWGRTLTTAAVRPSSAASLSASASSAAFLASTCAFSERVSANAKATAGFSAASEAVVGVAQPEAEAPPAAWRGRLWIACSLSSNIFCSAR